MRAPSLLLALVVISSVAPPVVADGHGAYGAPLDVGSERVGAVTVDGTTYDVYRYDNALPYASGYEFLDDGARVVSSEEARRIALAYAWETAIRERMETDDVRSLRDVGRTAERADAVVSAPVDVINTTLSFFERARERGSLWEIAVSSLPELRTAESVLVETRDGLERWSDSVGALAENTERVADVSEAVLSDEGTDYNGLPTLFENTSEGLREAERVSGTVAGNLRRVTNRSEAIADEAEGVRLVGDEIAPPLRRLSSSLGNTTAPVERFEASAAEARKAVEATRENATESEGRLWRGWNRRRTAGVRVYGTALLLIAAAALAAYLYGRRRDEGDEDGA